VGSGRAPLDGGEPRGALELLRSRRLGRDRRSHRMGRPLGPGGVADAPKAARVSPSSGSPSSGTQPAKRDTLYLQVLFGIAMGVLVGGRRAGVRELAQAAGRHLRQHHQDADRAHRVPHGGPRHRLGRRPAAGGAGGLQGPPLLRGDDHVGAPTGPLGGPPHPARRGHPRRRQHAGCERRGGHHPRPREHHVPSAPHGHRAERLRERVHQRGDPPGALRRGALRDGPRLDGGARQAGAPTGWRPSAWSSSASWPW
jgi:hypothetical protein